MLTKTQVTRFGALTAKGSITIWIFKKLFLLWSRFFSLNSVFDLKSREITYTLFIVSLSMVTKNHMTQLIPHWLSLLAWCLQLNDTSSAYFPCSETFNHNCHCVHGFSLTQEDSTPSMITCDSLSLSFFLSLHTHACTHTNTQLHHHHACIHAHTHTHTHIYTHTHTNSDVSEKRNQYKFSVKTCKTIPVQFWCTSSFIHLFLFFLTPFLLSIWT